MLTARRAPVIRGGEGSCKPPAVASGGGCKCVLVQDRHAVPPCQETALAAITRRQPRDGLKLC